MISPQSKFVLLYYFLFILILISFLIGFFPIDRKNISQNLNSNRHGEVRRKDNTINKLVLLIIDALRSDFLEIHKNDTAFIQSSLDARNACLFKVRAAAPTVTMPRIKAITSGTIPNYLDVIWNLGGSEFNQDSFVRQAYLQGMNLVFYGDETWLKLFPNYFVRNDATHSFYAEDFWEVDKNVTDRVGRELLRNDWDIMILHYLGLDHIGHIEGPQSKHIPTKLAEMDAVIRRISLYLQDKGPYLFLVTGDHGMKDSGGHGGVTQPEVYVPLLSMGYSCHTLTGWPNVTDYVPDQTDIAPTISAALGLSVPEGNSGKLIPALLPHFHPKEFLEMFAQLKLLLMERSENAASNVKPSYENNQNTSTLQELNARYFDELSLLTSNLNLGENDFNLVYMAISCCASWILLLTYALFLIQTRPANALHVILLVGTVAHTLSLTSTSFIEEEHQSWYFLWITLVLISIRERWRRKIVVRSFVPDIKSCSLILLCAMHRFLRKLNQTGDKWAHLPDWHDFFRENHLWLFVLYISAVSWLYRIFASHNRSQCYKVMYLAALAFIINYRVTTGRFRFLADIFPQSRGTTEVIGFFFLILLFGYLAVVKGGTDIKWLWVLLAALTLRPHNLILIPAMMFTSQQLYSVFHRDENNFWNTLAHLWMGNVFYFYQGHSNSIANIDVAPAFIGCWTFIPTYGFMMTIIHTYAHPVLCFLLSPKNYSAVLFTRLFPMTIYCTLTFFQRHHLFVWSVFSPKLLLDSSLTLVLFFVVSFHKIVKLYFK